MAAASSAAIFFPGTYNAADAVALALALGTTAFGRPSVGSMDFS